MKKLLTLTNNPFLQSSGIILAGSLISNIVNYVFNLAMGRLMSPAEYGAVVTIVTLTMLIGTPAKAVTLVLAKRISELRALGKQQQIGSLFSLTVKVSWVAGLVSILILAALAPWLADFFHTEITPFIVFSFIVLGSLLTATGNGTLQGLEEFVPLSISGVIGSVGKLILSVGFVLLGYSVSGVIAALVITLMITYWYARTKAAKHIELKPQDVKVPFHPKAFALSLPKSFWSILFTTILLALFTSIDVVLAKHYFEPDTAGLYSALAILGRIITYASAAVVTVLLPAASAADTKQHGAGFKLLLHALLVVGSISAAAVVVFALVPELVVSLLFGNTYISIAPYLAQFGVAMFLGSISLVLIHYFIAINNKVFTYPFLVATLALIGGIMLLHEHIADLVLIQQAANALLLIGMLGVLFVHKLQRSPHTSNDISPKQQENT